jgi:hypothetical protein
LGVWGLQGATLHADVFIGLVKREGSDGEGRTQKEGGGGMNIKNVEIKEGYIRREEVQKIIDMNAKIIEINCYILKVLNTPMMQVIDDQD